MYYNEILKAINIPNCTKIGRNFLKNNEKFKNKDKKALIEHKKDINKENEDTLFQKK